MNGRHCHIDAAAWMVKLWIPKRFCRQCLYLARVAISHRSISPVFVCPRCCTMIDVRSQQMSLYLRNVGRLPA